MKMENLPGVAICNLDDPRPAHTRNGRPGRMDDLRIIIIIIISMFKLPILFDLVINLGNKIVLLIGRIRYVVGYVVRVVWDPLQLFIAVKIQ